MTSTLPPIRRHLVVDAAPEHAYRVFTDGIGTWWPLARFSVYETGNTVAFEGEQIVERSVDGASNTWGAVLSADPPHRIRFTWHPGHDDDRGEVEVTFTPVGERQTLVTLVHSGWEAYADAAPAARDEYRGGWPAVLGGFGAAANAGPAGDETIWLVLGHTAGTAAGAEGVFAHPLFAEHRAFLEALAEDGALVAAGPLPDEPGAGQTVIRIAARDASAYLQRAEADPSVTGELLQLRVRPWRVVLP